MKTLLNDGWKFLLQPLDSTLEEVQKKMDLFVPVNIPHDWQIYEGTKLYEDGTGWYVRYVDCSPQRDREYELYFEGVYMDTTVYVNGHKAGEWKYGYSSFAIVISEFLQEGTNEILVQVKVQHPNSRWYSGAGIYRNVYWKCTDQIRFVADSSYIVSKQAAKNQWITQAYVAVKGSDDQDTYFGVAMKNRKGDIVAQNIQCLREALQVQQVPGFADDEKVCGVTFAIENPDLWSLENPNLYQIEMSLYTMQGQERIMRDFISEKTGFREFRFDQNEGCFINGKYVKINGVCEHHDLGAIGAAYYQQAMRRKLEILKQMGVNAIRTSHNMPAKGLLELTDEMGFLVMDESFDMWERPKTTYDYARFFDAWYEKDVASWIRRDRNHVSIMFWSIGNEIYDTHADYRGLEVTRLLRDEVKKHDPQQNAVITIGSNYMPWENARKCADELKFAGYNYGEKYYDEHHKAHPDWYIYGSETASTVQSRGIYHFPYKQSLLADDDEQCSSLGNSSTSWGAKNSEYCIIAERDRKYSLGQFIWTGFDYIGEPTPYHTRNSYFGQIDTAGFPKDSYYVYQSAWVSYKEKPMIHIFPYWDFNPGQQIDVRVATNAPFVELLINGKSQGIQEIDHAHGTKLTGDWLISYEAGEVTAIGYDENKIEIVREQLHSFGDVHALKISQYKPERKACAGCNDLLFLTITAEDALGYPVENANNWIQVDVQGAGWLTGLDNGDSTDVDEYKGTAKRLFNGKLLAIIAVGDQLGNIRVTVSAEHVKGCVINIPVEEMCVIPGTSHLPEVFETRQDVNDKAWIRKITLLAPQNTVFSPEEPKKKIQVCVAPQYLNDTVNVADFTWKIVNDAGVESNLAAVTLLKDGVEVIAKGDGTFYLRCMTKNGCGQVKVISSIGFTARGLGQAYLNPYELIPGALYTYAEGEVGAGNEHGVATARDSRTVVGFENIDFGVFGSDTITVPIFELGGNPCSIQIWEGIPQKADSILLAEEVYHKPSIWNVYQEDTYRLKKRLTGITNLYFVVNMKIHIKGFYFEKQKKSLSLLYAGEADQIYGDQFEKTAKEVLAIGNNVTLDFADMDFEREIHQIEICGKTQNDVNTIHIQFTDEETGENIRQIVEFEKALDWTSRTFTLSPIKGNQTVHFIFLPGSEFDFLSFQFL